MELCLNQIYKIYDKVGEKRNSSIIMWRRKEMGRRVEKILIDRMSNMKIKGIERSGRE